MYITRVTNQTDLHYAVAAANMAAGNAARRKNTQQDILQGMQDGALYYLLHVSGQAVGSFAVILYIDGTADVFNFAIFPGFRNKGYGKQGMQYILDKLREWGINETFLKVHSDNKCAIHVYISCGYLKVGEDDLYVYMRHVQIKGVKNV